MITANLGGKRPHNGRPGAIGAMISSSLLNNKNNEDSPMHGGRDVSSGKPGMQSKVKGAMMGKA